MSGVILCLVLLIVIWRTWSFGKAMGFLGVLALSLLASHLFGLAGIFGVFLPLLVIYAAWLGHAE
jgi:hypothetical protein